MTLIGEDLATRIVGSRYEVKPEDVGKTLVFTDDRNPLTKGLPVNYNARAAGPLRKLLDLLDNLDDKPGRQTQRPLSYTLANLDPDERYWAEAALYMVLVTAYRRGLLP